MPVNPRGNRFEATVNNKSLPNGRLRRLFPSEQSALQWEASIKAKLEAGHTITEEDRGGTGKVAGPATISELCEIVVDRHWSRQRGSKSTIQNARQCVRVLGENLTLASLNMQRVDDLVFAFRAMKNKDTTINRKMSALRVMIEYAVERDWLPKSLKLPHYKENNGRIRYISPDEEAEMLAYFDFVACPDMKDIFVVGLDTGLRCGEILALQKRDVENGVVTVWQPKNDKPRSVPMTKRVQAIMERRASEPGNKVFEGWSHGKLRHRWDSARNHLGLMDDPQFVPHAMRHTFCSRLAQRGVDMASISKLAGHSSLQMTMRYSHLCPKNLRAAIEALDEGRSAA